MRMSVMPDGVVLDHVSEFVFGPKGTLQGHYAADRAMYVDALARLLQALMTHGCIAMGRGAPKKVETARLRAYLESEGRIEITSGLDEAQRDARRKKLWPLLREEYWPKICTALSVESNLVQGLVGHAARESDHFFDEKSGERWSSHYVSTEQALRLPEQIRDQLALQVSRRLATSGRSPSSFEIEMFVDRTFTTYYLIFLEYWWYYRDQYLPGYLRANFDFVRTRNKNNEVLRFVAECYAAKMIAKTKERGALLKQAIDWCDKGEGRRVANRMGDLAAALESQGADEQQRVAEAISAELGPRRQSGGIVHRVLTGGVSVLAQSVTLALGDPVRSAALGVKAVEGLSGGASLGKDLRWLLKVPTEDRYSIAKKTRELLE